MSKLFWYRVDVRLVSYRNFDVAACGELYCIWYEIYEYLVQSRRICKKFFGQVLIRVELKEQPFA